MFPAGTRIPGSSIFPGVSFSELGFFKEKNKLYIKKITVSLKATLFKILFEFQSPSLGR